MSVPEGRRRAVIVAAVRSASFCGLQAEAEHRTLDVVRVRCLADSGVLIDEADEAVNVVLEEPDGALGCDSPRLVDQSR